MVAGKYTLFLNRDFWVQPDCHAEGSLPFWHAVLLITALAYLNPCASRPDCMGETRCGLSGITLHSQFRASSHTACDAMVVQADLWMERHLCETVQNYAHYTPFVTN
jgi:hypothetical protein